MAWRGRSAATIVRAATALVVVVFGAPLACAPRGPAPVPRAALEVVESLHQRLLEDPTGQSPLTHALIDYRYRLAEMLGPIWKNAPETDRARAVEMAQEMFAATTAQRHSQYQEGSPWIRAERRSPDQVWITATARRSGKPDFVWMYRVTRRSQGWRITQREFALGPARSDTSAFYPMAGRHLSRQYGRLPSLSEFNANLPSLMGRLKVRRLTIPELPGRDPSPSKGQPPASSGPSRPSLKSMNHVKSPPPETSQRLRGSPLPAPSPGADAVKTAP